MQELLDRLQRLRGEGVLSARTADGRLVTYRSDPELQAAIADLERRIAQATAGAPREIRIAATKGLES